MKLSRHISVLLVCILFQAAAFAQPGFKVDIDKPKPYEERKLKAEKTGDGKLKAPKRIMQNLTTRFNYFFNAANRFNEVLDRARQQHKDDYAQLLSFYNYDLNATAADSAQLDSLIYKAKTGILNHDLRNEWIDELYLLWAASWHLQKKFDSASQLLQFINYAYAPQYEDGYYKHIGTQTDGARELSIATKEDKKFLHSNTFSRNNAFLWQIRTRIEMGDFTRAGSLIATLKRDPVFPKRLGNGLDEVEAYWNYRQQRWDSAAVHLLAALDGAYTKQEKARWTYLAAQMMEKAGKTEEAIKLYDKVVGQTPDPVMEVYARLNLVRLSKEGGEGSIDKNVAELLKMARRDKYEDYRDIIYFMAAQMEMERGNMAAASELLIKGSKFNTGNPSARNSAFLQIADVSYAQKKYIQAASFYDSVQVADLAEMDAKRVSDRKGALQKVVMNTGVVARQDSLQRIAAMPAEEREALIKAMVKKLRKAQGLKEETVLSAGNSFVGAANNAPADLFSTQQKGEWYFYNNTAKSQGSAQFKAVWGNRPNTDNWRRFAIVSQQMQVQANRGAGPMDPNATAGTDNVSAGNVLTVEGLLSKLPLTPEAVQASNDSIRNGLFQLGLAYLNAIEDYPSAISTFEELRRRFPETDKMDEVLFNLHYAYSKTGNAPAAAQAKKLLSDKYPASRFTAIASTGKDPLVTAKVSPEATRDYENVYNLFIEGRFSEAVEAKRIADSTYKTNFWQPQLLYIESVYYIKQREDSVAKNVLQTIIRQNNNKALTAKAQNLINVLARRQQIEDELNRLQITRPSDDDSSGSQPIVTVEPPPVKKDTVVVKKPVTDPAKDSAALAQIRKKQISDSIALSKVLAQRLRDSLATVKRDSLAQKALADKQRRDSIASAKIAREQARKDSIALSLAMRKMANDSAALSKYLAKRQRDSLQKVTRDSLLLVKKQADEALRDSLARKALADKQRKDSIALAKALREQARKDSLAQVQAILKQQRDSAALARLNAKPPKDTAVTIKPPVRRPADTIARKPAVDPNAYFFEPAQPHYAVIILDKVDPIFVSEAKNAFSRYNKEKYSSLPLDVQILNITADTRVLLVSGLTNAALATDYATRAKSLAATEIIPWLTGNKYSFSVISARNLEILKTKTDIQDYKMFLEQHLPGKF